MSSNHSLSFDVLKGIGIILVVLGHTVHGPWHNWTYTFYMPLFFLISGVFFHPVSCAFVKRCKRLLVPYLIFGFLTYLYWRFVEFRFRGLPDGLDSNWHLLDLFWQTKTLEFNVALWFLPCLFLCQIVVDCLFRKEINKYFLWSIFMIWIILCSLFKVKMEYRWISELFYSFPFFFLGFLLNNSAKKFDDKMSNTSSIWKFLMCIPLVLVILFPHGGDMMTSNYPNGYLMFFVLAIVCVFSIYILSTIFVGQKWLVWLGQNTLVLMCLHEPLKRIVIK